MERHLSGIGIIVSLEFPFEVFQVLKGAAGFEFGVRKENHISAYHVQNYTFSKGLRGKRWLGLAAKARGKSLARESFAVTSKKARLGRSRAGLGLETRGLGK